jgi:hypothetical protein
MGMVVNNSEVKEKNKISVGVIITKKQLNSTFFPEEVKNEVRDSPFYLVIFISREDSIKMSCFPTNTSNIKKILIKLKEFSPELVKGISSVLNELNLSKEILHTTGICYELENCFYETYLIGDAFKTEQISLKNIKQKFMAIPQVVNVNVEDIIIHTA